MTTSTSASQAELKANRVPLAWRDGCSALVSPCFLAQTCQLILAFRIRVLRVLLNLHTSFVDSLLLPLNVCRKGTWYLPWECEHERHAYEKCVYLFLVAE